MVKLGDISGDWGVTGDFGWRFDKFRPRNGLMALRFGSGLLTDLEDGRNGELSSELLKSGVSALCWNFFQT